MIYGEKRFTMKCVVTLFKTTKNLNLQTAKTVSQRNAKFFKIKRYYKALLINWCKIFLQPIYIDVVTHFLNTHKQDGYYLLQ